MTLHKPWIMQPAVADPDLTYTAQEIRMYATGEGVITGNQVLTPADFAVTQRGAGANFSVDVAAGICGVTGDDISNQGLYLAWNDATVNVATPAAPGSGTRVHRLVLQVRDKLSNGTYTTYDAILSVLPDTGGGTPAEPASAITLALISISTGQVSVTNANITGPPVPRNDPWHTLGTLAAYSPVVGRYRLTQFNEVEIDIKVTSGGANAATTTFAVTLPASRQPLVDHRQPLSSTFSFSGGAFNLPHAFIGGVTGGSSGQVQVIQNSNVSATIDGTFVVPLD